MRHTHKFVVLAGVISVLAAVGVYAALRGGPGISSIESARSSDALEALTDSPSTAALQGETTASRGTSVLGRLKDPSKPPKDKDPVEPPPSADPPTDPPVVPQDPPVVPEEPPVIPEPVAPPVPPAAPAAAGEVACVSADMADVITFAAPSEGEVTTFSLLRSATPDGEFSLVTTAGPGARSFVAPVSVTGAWFYRIGVTGPGGEGPLSAVVTNERVLMSAEVTPEGRTLSSSNGEMSLTLASGSYATTTTVTVSEVSGSPTGGLISLAGIYEITPTGPLGAPATVKIAYTLSVEHFQVAEAILSQAGLMTYDEASGEWVEDAGALTADGTYLTGTLSHFSYWTAATVQPHGTSTTAYCSTGPATEGGFCHDLSTYPGSTTRIAARDSQVCYNCHGSESLSGPPAGATGENVQAAINGAGTISRHPVATGGLYCTACHDPHADPTASPGLLKAWNPATGTYVTGGGTLAPGNDFCWTCHGAIRNRRIEYLHPNYYTDSGGDKKTRFTGGAHSAGNAATQRLDTKPELERGVLTGTYVETDGTVRLPLSSIEMPKPGTPVAVPAASGGLGGIAAAYDGDPDTFTFWNGPGDMGATAGNGWIGTAYATIDLGVNTLVSSFEYRSVYEYQPDLFTAHVLEIQTSSDNVAFTPLVAQGTLGTRLPTTVRLNASTECRYVRFVFSKVFPSGAGSNVRVNELTIWGRPTAGTYVLNVDLARNATYEGGTVRWSASTPPSTSVSVTARGSINNGTTWTGPDVLTNGGPVTQIAQGASLQNAILELTVEMSSADVGTSPSLDWIEVTSTRGTISGSPPTWTGDSSPNECQRCHVPHGSPESSLVTTESTQRCTACHTASYGGSYFGPAQFAASAHEAVTCTACHGSHGTANGPNGVYGFLLPNTRQELCFGCHSSVKADFDKKTGAASEWAKHDVYSGDQAKTGSRIRCGNCHSVHSATGLVDPDSITTPYAAYRDDPTSIPTEQRIVYASKDTVIDSATPTMNYGAASTVTLTGGRRLLLYFDLSSIPATATIQHAALVLWPSGSQTTGYYVYPLSRDWLEGNSTGAVNSAVTNGATWYEWKYGDNVHTGDIAGGDWSAAGGDRGALAATRTNQNTYTSLDVTALVEALHAGPNLGVMVTPISQSYSYATFLREYSVEQYRPKLLITYRTGPASSQVVDDVAFCLKCHDGSMPMGLSGQTLNNIAATYSTIAHGSKQGLGPESSINDRDSGGGGLKAPYTYGMDPLPCTTCHDPHGSSLPMHLREVVNGRSMVPPMTTAWGYTSVLGTASFPAIASSGWFCGACHIYPTVHNMEASSGCSCHGHSGSRM